MYWGYNPPYVDRLWGIWGSDRNILPKAIFYLLEGDYIQKTGSGLHVQFQRNCPAYHDCMFSVDEIVPHTMVVLHAFVKRPGPPETYVFELRPRSVRMKWANIPARLLRELS